MAVVIGCLVPHPPIIIPEIGKESLGEVEATISAMKQLAAQVAGAEPDTLVFISPHSTNFRDSIAVKASPVLKGSLAEFGAPEITLSVMNDLDFVKELAKVADIMQVPMNMVGVGYYNAEGVDELDHGIMVPLHYLRQAIDVPIASVAISFHGYEDHFELGRAIRKAAQNAGKNIAFIASGDLSHKLKPDAPAGYSPAGQEFDALIKDIFERSCFEELEDIDWSLPEDAGECGLRSIYTLAGVFSGEPVDTQVLSYEGSLGVGYMVAAVHPREVKREAGRGAGRKTAQGTASGEHEGMEAPAGGHSAPVRLAKYALEQYMLQRRVVEPPADTPDELLMRQAGTFVCLKLNNSLRGCVGTVQPTKANLAEEIMANAVQAAMADPRFRPVSIDELYFLDYTVDILEEPERIESVDQLDPKVYGVVVHKGGKTGLLLPDIEEVDTAEQQVEVAKQKAGIAPDEEVELLRFKIKRYE